MDTLKDPGKTRVVKNLPLPPHRPLSPDVLFKDGVIQVNLLKDFLRKEGRIALDDYKKIVRQAAIIFSTSFVTKEANLILSW